MKITTALFISALGILLSACASTSSQNHASQQKAVSKYYVENFNLELSTHKQAWTTEASIASYPSADTIQALLQDEVIKSLKAQGLYADDKATAAALDIRVSYTRNFALVAGVGYPTVSYSISGKAAGHEIAGYRSGTGSPEPGGRKSLWNDQKIAFGQYDQVEEREDVARLARIIADSIAGLQ